MIAACEHRDGWLILTRDDESTHLIPLEAVASWSELLGISDPAEVAAAVEYVATHGEPDPDPETQANVWTDAYQLLSHREQAREAEASRAVAEGSRDDPRSPQLRAAFAAYEAVHQPIDGGECVMDRCRRSVRDQLGIAEPTRKRSVATRAMPPSIAEVEADPDTQALAEVLRGHEDELLRCTKEFLHSLTDFDSDPLDPAPAPAPANEDEPISALRQKYGG